VPDVDPLPVDEVPPPAMPPPPAYETTERFEPTPAYDALAAEAPLSDPLGDPGSGSSTLTPEADYALAPNPTDAGPLAQVKTLAAEKPVVFLGGALAGLVARQAHVPRQLERRLRGEVTDMTTQSGEPTARARAAEASPGELASEVAKDMSTLVRQEVALAKSELQQEAKTAGTAVGAFGGAGFAGYFVLVFLSLAMMWALGSIMALGWAALIVAAVWAVIAGVFALVGRRKLKGFNPKPERTIETVKEDVQWAKTRNS